MKAELEQNGISMELLCVGNSDWIRGVIIPLSNEIEPAIPQHTGEIPPPLRQRMTRGAFNGALEFAAAGITLYFLKKAADDFYDVTVKPRIRKIFERLDEKLFGGNRNAKKVFIVNFWHQEHHAVVSVMVVADDFGEIAKQLDLIGMVHLNALTWISERGVSAPVHHYKIEGGKVNAQPLLLDRVDQTFS